MRARAVGFVAIVACAITSCSTPESRPVALNEPDRASFAPVSAFLDHRCGSIDCHGSRYRNLKLYGKDGLRLSATDRIFEQETTPKEIEANFRSVVGLEPERMSEVVREGGLHPERLSLLRKARGSDDHKGQALMAPGDDQDRCITSWLAGATDAEACKRALAIP